MGASLHFLILLVCVLLSEAPSILEDAWWSLQVQCYALSTDTCILEDTKQCNH